jgi:hypothetical protein
MALIESVRRLRDMRVEVSIADQESTAENRTALRGISDKFCEVSDQEIWNLGLANAKNKAVDQASNEWVIIGDPGEIWHENFFGWSGGIVDAIQKDGGKTPVYRVLRGPPEVVRQIVAGQVSMAAVRDDNARIYSRSIMRLFGFTHDAPRHRVAAQGWGHWARKKPCAAWVEHKRDEQDDPRYVRRKTVLYHHLLHKIVTEPQFRSGTDPYWYHYYWERVVKPGFKEVSFEDWLAIGG